MMNDQDKVYLVHMLDAITAIEAFIAGTSEQAFMADDLVQSAVIRKFEIIGEAAKRISPTAKQSSLDIAWKQAAGMRDVLIHDYFGVDARGVWNTAQDHLPRLKHQLEQLIKP